ncbi:hypothetical protein B0H13DRAFT_2361678 [Mycena leptocephala]|nr:hypothetical protein B0H13DRAFT_2361678 [Mycena leptocephala]
MPRDLSGPHQLYLRFAPSNRLNPGGWVRTPPPGICFKIRRVNKRFGRRFCPIGLHVTSITHVTERVNHRQTTAAPPRSTQSRGGHLIDPEYTWDQPAIRLHPRPHEPLRPRRSCTSVCRTLVPLADEPSNPASRPDLKRRRIQTACTRLAACVRMLRNASVARARRSSRFTPSGLTSAASAMFPLSQGGASSRRLSFSRSNLLSLSAVPVFSCSTYGRTPSPMPAILAIRTPPGASAAWTRRYDERVNTTPEQLRSTATRGSAVLFLA